MCINCGDIRCIMCNGEKKKTFGFFDSIKPKDEPEIPRRNPYFHPLHDHSRCPSCRGIVVANKCRCC